MALDRVVGQQLKATLGYTARSRWLTAGMACGAGNGAKGAKAEKERKEKELRDMLEEVGV